MIQLILLYPALAAAAASLMRLWIQHGPTVISAASETLGPVSSAAKVAGARVAGHASQEVLAAVRAWRDKYANIGIPRLRNIVKETQEYIERVTGNKTIVANYAKELEAVGKAKNTPRYSMDQHLADLRLNNPDWVDAAIDFESILVPTTRAPVKTNGIPLSARTVPRPKGQPTNAGRPGAKPQPPPKTPIPIPGPGSGVRPGPKTPTPISNTARGVPSNLTNSKVQELLTRYHLRFEKGQGGTYVLQQRRDLSVDQNSWKNLPGFIVPSMFKSPNDLLWWLERKVVQLRLH
ncbi:hypothetical protein [Archangium sp.]|jgi:hypothetical protein|uniref:hypothetical protein n=1 Tax=Archangium sp. TaxID=1872627 RepID=UPI002ED93FBA